MKKNSNRNISGFTLVELIVVIVILGVLSTIGFVSYVGYLEGVRDTNRISQVSNMQSGLEVLRSKDSFVPLPDDSVQVLSDTGSILTYQGYAGENIVNTINYSKSGKDPQSGSYYTYSVSADKKYFQIMAFLEEQANVTAFNINQAKAIDYTNFYSYVAGDKLGILTQTGTNTPVQEITSIKTAGSLNLTTDTTNSYIVTSSNTRNITATGSSVTTELTNLLAKIKNPAAIAAPVAQKGLYLWLWNQSKVDTATQSQPTTEELGDNAGNAVISVSTSVNTQQTGSSVIPLFTTDMTLEVVSTHMCYTNDSSELRLTFKKEDNSEDGYVLFNKTGNYAGQVRIYKNGSLLLTHNTVIPGKTYTGYLGGDLTFGNHSLSFTTSNLSSNAGLTSFTQAYDFSDVSSIEVSGHALTTYSPGNSSTCVAATKVFLK